MNYSKIKEQVYNAGYCDDRKIICHSYRSYMKTDDYMVVMKFRNIKTEMPVPQFHILSIKDDKLCISYAKAFGGFKKYYASIELKKLHYKFSHLIDGMVMVHCFGLIDDNVEEKNFFIIAIKNKDDAQLLVDAIKKYE